MNSGIRIPRRDAVKLNIECSIWPTRQTAASGLATTRTRRGPLVCFNPERRQLELNLGERFSANHVIAGAYGDDRPLTGRLAEITSQRTVQELDSPGPPGRDCEIRLPPETDIPLPALEDR